MDCDTRLDLPKNTIDISHIIKRSAAARKTELEQNMDDFCKMLEKIMQARADGTDFSDDDEDETNVRRKHVEKNLKCVTDGIEKEKSVEMLSEKQRIKRGKVIIVSMN